MNAPKSQTTLSNARRMVLHKCNVGWGGLKYWAGLSPTFAQQAGYARQVNWLLRNRLIREKGGRFVSTVAGRKLLMEVESV